MFTVKRVDAGASVTFGHVSSSNFDVPYPVYIIYFSDSLGR